MENTSNSIPASNLSIFRKILELCKKSFDRIYNINETVLLQNTNTVTLTANTYHSYSILVKEGNIDLIESGVTVTIPKGYTISESASTVFTNSITITGKSSDTYVIIKTLK